MLATQDNEVVNQLIKNHNEKIREAKKIRGNTVSHAILRRLIINGR